METQPGFPLLFICQEPSKLLPGPPEAQNRTFLPLLPNKKVGKPDPQSFLLLDQDPEAQTGETCPWWHSLSSKGSGTSWL